MFLTALLALTLTAPPDAKPRDVLLKKLEQATDKNRRGTIVRAIAQLQRTNGLPTKMSL